MATRYRTVETPITSANAQEYRDACWDVFHVVTGDAGTISEIHYPTKMIKVSGREHDDTVWQPMENFIGFEFE
jgi:hypothetical protein